MPLTPLLEVNLTAQQDSEGQALLTVEYEMFGGEFYPSEESYPSASLTYPADGGEGVVPRISAAVEGTLTLNWMEELAP
jgi:hypothetical protein